jgi:RNA polymerase sigma factor for flagellar operon FliA
VASARPVGHAVLDGDRLGFCSPERLKLVVQLYFVEELNLAEIAEVLTVSVPRVHQLKAQALGKLREALEGMAEII